VENLGSLRDDSASYLHEYNRLKAYLLVFFYLIYFSSIKFIFTDILMRKAPDLNPELMK